MGLVLAFETTPRTASRPAPQRREPTQGADILFFTGVRYERDADADAGDPARSPESLDLPHPVS